MAEVSDDASFRPKDRIAPELYSTARQRHHQTPDSLQKSLFPF